MITIVIGAQFGGEGKGKIAAFLAKHGDAEFDIVCRCGGVNSSHTIVDQDRTYKFRMLPTAVTVLPRCKIVFGAGSLIHIGTLLSEMADWNISSDRVLIDRNAGIVTDDCVAEQRLDTRYASIGSTMTGTGYATSRRALRKLALASSYAVLAPMICDVTKYLFNALSVNSNILVEGHQGSMLSNYHGDYPYTSSRDCIAAAMLSELGVGLSWPSEVILVAKTFETRNHAGLLTSEITTSHALTIGVSERGGGAWGIPNVDRRVGLFGMEVLQRAVYLNTPSFIALTGADYLTPSIRGLRDSSLLTSDLLDLILSIEATCKVPVRLVSTGPETDHGFFRGKLDRRPQSEARDDQSLRA
jgi:adenylosuccinate synthase